MFFVFFNLNIQGFDFLPDVLGYILIIVGLKSVKEYSVHFEKGIPLAIAGALISLIVYIPFGNDYIYIIPGVILTVIMVLLFFKFFSGLSELAVKLDNRSLHIDIESKKGTYSTLAAISMIGAYLIFVAPVIGILSAIVAFIICIVMLVKLNKFIKAIIMTNNLNMVDGKSIITDEPWNSQPQAVRPKGELNREIYRDISEVKESDNNRPKVSEDLFFTDKPKFNDEVKNENVNGNSDKPKVNKDDFHSDGFN
jgi:hypothetical protein